MRNVMVSGWAKQEDGKMKFVELGIAIFHQFGFDYEEFENGAANYSTAIIEYADGRMGNVRVEHVQFLSPNV